MNSPADDRGPADSTQLWTPRRKLARKSPVPPSEPPPPPEAEEKFRRFLKQRRVVLLTLAIIIAGDLPFLVGEKDVRSDVRRKWLHQEQILEEPESPESSRPETAGVETGQDSFKKDVRSLLRTLGAQE